MLAAVALGRTGDENGVAGSDVAAGTRLVRASVTQGHQTVDLGHYL